MALIKCIECSKEFSDRASVCPNCGCPTEIVLEELSRSNDKKDIVDTYNIWGTDFFVNKKDEQYILLMKRIREIRNKILNNVIDQYYKYKNIDAVIEGLPEFYSQILELMVSTAVSMLTQNGIYDCDIENFLDKYGASFDLSALMEPIITRYLEIQNFEREAIEYREYVRQQRLHTWSGGGFGVKGALKGYFKAQLLNVGTEFLHLHSDNVNHHNNMVEVAKAKKKLYEDESTKNIVINALMDIYDICFKSVIEELRFYGKISKTFVDEEKAGRIINNIFTMLNSENFNIMVVKEQCLIAFQLDPVRQDLIELMINIDYSSEDSDLIRYAKDYGFYDIYLKNKQSFLENQFRDQIDEITDSDIGTNECFKKVMEKCLELREKGLDISDIFKQVCQNRSKYPVSSKDLLELNKWFNSILLDLNDGEIGCFKGVFGNVEIDDSNIEEINELIKNFCSKYAQNQKDDFYFLHDSKVDIRKQKKFKDFQTHCKLPKDAYVYMTYGRYKKDYPEVLIVLTNKGIYISEGLYSDKIFWTWKEYANSDIEVYNYKLKLGEKFFSFYCETDLEHLILELHNELVIYFEKGESQYIYYNTQLDKRDELEEVLNVIDLDCNGFVESFCMEQSKYNEEYKTKISIYDSKSILGAGYDVFWLCYDNQSDITEYWNRYKNYWDFKDDVKLYGIDVSICRDGKDERCVLFTSKGIYIYSKYYEKEQAVYCEWIDFSLLQYYLIDKDFNPKIVLGDEQFFLGNRATSFIIKLRNELHKFVILNSREIKKKIDIDRLTQSVAKSIWEICRGFYPGPIMTEYNRWHNFLLLESDKKKDDYEFPKETAEYLFDRIQLGIPEEDEVYYMLSRCVNEVHSLCENDTGLRLAFYITDSGIYWYDRSNGGGNESWNFFKDCELRLIRGEGIYINDDFVYLKGESNFVFKILKKIQEYLISLEGVVIITPRLEAFCYGKGYEYDDFITPVLGNKSNIVLYSWHNSDISDAIRDYAPEIEKIFTKINSKWFNATGGLLHFIYLKNINKGILVTENMILCSNSCGMFFVKYKFVEKFVFGRNENSVPCLFVYYYNGKKIEKGYVEVDDESIEIDLSLWNQKIEKKFARREIYIDKTTEIESVKMNQSEEIDINDVCENSCISLTDLIDDSKSGDFKSNGCKNAYETLYGFLNEGETIASILAFLNHISETHLECATSQVNRSLFEKVTKGIVSEYFDKEEKPLFYKDSAILFYGKNGILITDKSIYRIRKNGIKKISISNLNSIHLDKLLFKTEEDECRWFFNADREFELDTIGINTQQSGCIMALVCLLFKKNNSNRKIKFYNYL